MPSTLAIPGVILLTIKQFCGESLFAAEAHITVLKRYKYRSGPSMSSSSTVQGPVNLLVIGCGLGSIEPPPLTRPALHCNAVL